MQATQPHARLAAQRCTTRAAATSLCSSWSHVIDSLGASASRALLDVALLTALGGAAPAHAFQSEGTVRIGSMEAQTGIPAAYGIQALVGSQIAIDEINAAGGVKVDGRMVKLALTPAPNGYDPGGDSAATIALMKKLVADDRVLAIKGTSKSANTEAAFNYLKELEKQGTPVVLLSSASASPGLGKISSWGFRNSFFESDLIQSETKLLHDKFGYKTAAIFVAKDNAANALTAQSVLRPALEKAGFKIVAETAGLENDSDLSAQIEALSKAQPDVVAVSTPVLAGVNLMKEAKRRGFAPKVWIGTIGNIAPEVPRLGGKAVEDMLVGSSYSPDQPKIAELAQTYRKRAGIDINLFGVNGYEAIYLFKAAIEASGIRNTPDTLQDDRKKFRDALAKVDIVSITGERVTFDAEHDAVKKGYLLTIRNGKYQIWDQKPFH
ncbi:MULTISPECIES: ABC transporter substrate-binding protein [unclassified Caballeronia]|uniref:ABC transporter substrate-binding protein n=1 Tax=unclassified Caballeronia TaxID=2646786 RepID=UPI002857DE37|nr:MULTISPECIES: ABC transporter substrate-binding protein [unclassified Caballeronia]MDR5823648.1 ABC transporter substrate-binding protein [Caballeronia sp. LZ043]MDR5881558.1 ABC transporter substrate-binding protein [Caballeronia sp. LZ032]